MPDARGGNAAAAKPTVKDFLFGKVIGEGSFSTVYLTKELKSNEEYAIKVCEKLHILRENKKPAVLREKHILSQLVKKPSPLVVQLKCSFQDEDRLYFVITYAKNGDLLKYIHKVGNFNMDCTRFYSGEIMCALKYLHQAGVVHRDLKPENILMTDKMHIMLTDFGSARILPASQSHKKRNSFVGTAQYVSPEVLTDGPISPAMDLWALGCIIYQMVSGLPPFRSLQRTMRYAGADYAIFQSILKLEYNFPDDFDLEAKRLVELLLKLEPKERATIADLQRDPFYAQLDIDNIHLQEPPQIVPFLPGTEETNWDLVSMPGLDERQISRLLGLRLGESNSPENATPSTAESSKPVIRNGVMDFTPEDEESRLTEQRCKSEWHRFVEGNLILKKGMVDKKKGLFPRRRMLLLTTGPHLYYVDPEKMVRKGEIPWSPALNPEPKNFKTFFVHTPNRTYNLEDPEGYALRWCKAINEVYEFYYGQRK
ncbi:3-phosphoinositide-dependent protein kinase 1 [Galendromus occidentalis]|uniref:3-phosphoinositide-dependent protein kinase 1 n=1 Tax=Galendromus occidentalis TaxID=34638 RepID=A0AAJ7WJB0_9ACAR|nr:3-phosphoinositide-dependent protein kinase 1 [Galendromus occidentalis]